MNSIIKTLGLKPADRIVIPKSVFGIIQHHAIYYGQNDAGIDIIIENAIGIGVRYITAIDFFKIYGDTITRIEKFKGGESERILALKRAKSQVGRAYDLKDFNCESFCNYVQFKMISSRQIETALTLGGIILTGFIINSLFDANN